MRGRLLIATAVALIGLIFAVGCGDDEGSTAGQAGSTAAETTGGETTGSQASNGETTGGNATEANPAKAEFISQANALCARRIAEIQVKGRKVFKEVFKEPGPVAAKKLAQAVLVPTFTRELRELKALDQPAGDSEELGAFYRELEKIVDYFAGNPKPGSYPYNKAENLATRYGIEKCGTPQ